MKNDLKKIEKLVELLSVLNIPNANGIGLWEHEIGYKIISLDGKITVLIGTDAPDELWDAVENTADDNGIEISVCGDMVFNDLYYDDIYTDTINGGPNEWHCE